MSAASGEETLQVSRARPGFEASTNSAPEPSMPW